MCLLLKIKMRYKFLTSSVLYEGCCRIKEPIHMKDFKNVTDLNRLREKLTR